MKFLLQTLLFFTISLTFAQDFNIPDSTDLQSVHTKLSTKPRN